MESIWLLTKKCGLWVVIGMYLFSLHDFEYSGAMRESIVFFFV
jgi:hypothetical protein